MAATYDLHALIEEARRRARQRRWTYAGVLALLAGAGIWGGLALTSGSGAIPAPPTPPGYHLVRARGPVQHALVKGSFRSALNGYPVGKAARVHLEVWFDRDAGLIRERGRWANVRVPDEASRCACPSSFPEVLLGRYWPVDTTKLVRRPGIGTFHGREVIWLGKLSDTFAPGYRDGEWIALDPRTHDAVAWRLYGTNPTSLAGPILSETWVVRRFPNIAPNRFWFVLSNKLDVRFVRLHALPLDIPGRGPPRDLRHAARVVGRLGGATIFAVPRRDGFLEMFSVGKHGRVGGGPSLVSKPHTLRVGVVQVGHGGLFTSRAYLVASGSTLAKRGTKLFLVYPGGGRERIKLILTGRPAGAGFYYYVIPKVDRVRGRRATALELVRGSRLVARQMLPLPYQAPEQPGPVALRVALQVLDFQVPPSLG